MAFQGRGRVLKIKKLKFQRRRRVKESVKGKILFLVKMEIFTLNKTNNFYVNDSILISKL